MRIFIFFLFILCCRKINLLAAKNSYDNLEDLYDCSAPVHSLGTATHVGHISNLSKVYAIDPPNHEKPESSACIYPRESSFLLPVSSIGPKFVRLYFMPFSYPGFSISKALFTVSIGQYTLLTTTNSSYSGYNPKAGFIVREFCINLDDRNLNVTFTPSSMTSGAYAFVNRIEIVSMPTWLYIQEESPLPIIGNSSYYVMRNSTALEMMYRLNIGGELITEREDTGMFRRWTSDVDYFNGSDRSTISADVKINQGLLVPEYTAPLNVYKSAVEVVDTSKSTWLFPVDSGFYYLVRLHLCEISAAVQLEGGREFYIFINNGTAEDHADIFRWTHGAGVPVYKDYIVNFSKHVDDLKFLYISIGRSNNLFVTSKGAILNGLEIFKLSDVSNNLAGRHPFWLTNKAHFLDEDDGAFNSTVKKFVHFFFIASCLLLCILDPVICRKKRRGKKILSLNHCRVFSIAEIKSATNNFAYSSLIGTGGFGNVYKGSIDSGTTNVAVKRANPNSHQGLKEFQTEISMLSELRHNHLVSLIGYCIEGKEMILVYDYMDRGTLRDHLYKTQKPPIPWKQRLHICIGAARGLHYLHTGKKHTIIHRDIKSTNILLDDKWMAKVSDFGLSKVGPSPLAPSATQVSTIVKGTFGYLDPEYYRRQKLTEKSDVYSFGVVLFEVLCARPAVLAVGEFEEDDLERVSLAEWALQCYQMGTIDQIIDPFLKGTIVPECFKAFIDTARKCLADKGSERPSMTEVVWNLELAMRQQVTFELKEAVDDFGVDLQVIFSENSDQTPGVEFSEILVLQNSSVSDA